MAAAAPPASTRTLGAIAWLAMLAAVPLAAAGLAGVGPAELARAGITGLSDEVDAVGLVLVPQLLLAIAILGVALRRAAGALAWLPAARAPRWLEPAVESALLLGLLGTIHGMVSGFADLDPRELEPAPLLRGLGAALRSTFVGFTIALLGIWLKSQADPLPASGAVTSNGGR